MLLKARKINTVPFILNGKDVTSTSTFQVIGPATGDKIWDASAASIKDATHAVEVAQADIRLLVQDEARSSQRHSAPRGRHLA